MNTEQIISRCKDELGMSEQEAAWVAEHLDEYNQPDWSEMDWPEIDEMLRSTLWFRGKSEEEIRASLSGL